MSKSTIWRRVTQAAKLMVGVGDYQRYLAHMAQQHPEAGVMSEKEFFRHCQESRYGTKAGSIKRCPC
jgi:uncharacterized short protein YbdD (DUF466 family)